MVVDDALKLTGSNNWTRGSAENSEQLNLVPPAVAAAYANRAWRAASHWPEFFLDAAEHTK